MQSWTLLFLSGRFLGFGVGLFPFLRRASRQALRFFVIRLGFFLTSDTVNQPFAIRRKLDGRQLRKRALPKNVLYGQCASLLRKCDFWRNATNASRSKDKEQDELLFSRKHQLLFWIHRNDES